MPLSDKEYFLSQRIQKLERELDVEKRKNIDAHKALCKRERLVKELTVKTEQDKQLLKELQVVVEDLESSLRIQKNRINDVSTISDYNANRFRKVHKMYLAESGRSEQVMEELRRLKAGRTGLFVQDLS